MSDPTTPPPDGNGVHELQKKLEELQRKCAFLEKVLDEVPANIYISDMEKGVVWCNKTNEESLGYTLEEISSMGMGYIEAIVHPDDLNIPTDSINHYQHFDGAEFGGIFRAKHKNAADYRWYMGWAKAYSQDEEGRVQELVCVDVDMSTQMNTDEQLVKALKENLKHKNRLLVKCLRKRELEILGLICKGYNTKTIAEKLFISINTVSTHRKSIQKKMGTNNVADLVSLGKEAGLG